MLCPSIPLLLCPVAAGLTVSLGPITSSLTAGFGQVIELLPAGDEACITRDHLSPQKLCILRASVCVVLQSPLALNLCIRTGLIRFLHNAGSYRLYISMHSAVQHTPFSSPMLVRPASVAIAIAGMPQVQDPHSTDLFHSPWCLRESGSDAIASAELSIHATNHVHMHW